MRREGKIGHGNDTRSAGRKNPDPQEDLKRLASRVDRFLDEIDPDLKLRLGECSPSREIEVLRGALRLLVSFEREVTKPYQLSTKSIIAAA